MKRRVTPPSFTKLTCVPISAAQSKWSRSRSPMGCWSWQYRSSTALVCSQHSAEVGSLSERGETPSDGMAPPPVLSRAPPYPGEAGSAGGLPARLAASLAASPPSAGAEVRASASSAVWD